MKQTTVILIVYFTLLSFQGNAQLTVDGYTNYELSGFNVLVQNTALAAHADRAKEAIGLLEMKLIEIAQLPMEAVKIDALKAVPIFMDWNTTAGAAQYHPSKSWLVANGYIPEKAKGVEISNIENFINWTKQNQPYMVLHELAHAYQHRVLKNNSTLITNAYKNAVSANLYTNILYHKGGGEQRVKASAYALTNEKEYFAELTEAYFGINDYFPFHKMELRKYDTIGFKAVVAIWGNHTNAKPLQKKKQ
ncbi:hypothetical protein MWU65_01990 [Cellulophaga sp. F20128]|uniref:hypothetical protein n=1 Tax=Cellulophaga sp. F20128 TaxID=2926413 RepID=UPI001FF67563|nr:hypothetical protein [Cellulophaga sp. F20128]MCK0155931.1 hypothetical protein [Cellulophaga sp. F20128]